MSAVATSDASSPPNPAQPAGNQISEVEQILRARATLRDGFLFLALGLALLGAGMGGLLTGDSRETMTFLGVGLAAWTVLTGLGLYKLTLARHAGVRNAVTLAASIIVWLYAAAFIAAFCSYFLPRFFIRSQFMGLEPSTISWTAATVALTVLIAFAARKKVEAHRVQMHRGICWMVLSFLFAIYDLG